MKPYKIGRVKRSQISPASVDGTVNNGGYGEWSVAFALAKKAVQGRMPSLNKTVS